MVLCFCFEFPLFVNTLSFEVKKQNEYVVLGGVGEWSRILFQRKINVIVLISWTTVSNPLYAFLVRLTWGTRPF